MSNSLKCTNPSCQTFITVPEGSMQVICPSCNTWHFPSAIEQDSEGYQTPEGNGGYDAPPIPQDNFDENQGGASPIVDAYVSPHNINDPVPPKAVPVNNNEALAYLLTTTGERLVLRVGKNVIGRKNTDLIIDDRTVSRKHCIVEVANNQSGLPEFFIYDVGHLEGASSTNGVFISGRSLRLQDYERIPIGPETSIKIGNVNLVLKLMH